MNKSEFDAPDDPLNEINRETNHLNDFLNQYGREVPYLLEKENELTQQMIKSVQTLSQILENLEIPDKKDPTPEWITTREVALKYNISIRTQSVWRERGKLPFTQVELKIYYLKQDLELLFSKKYKRNNVPKVKPAGE
jgi:hypothetical protein